MYKNNAWKLVLIIVTSLLIVACSSDDGDTDTNDTDTVNNYPEKDITFVVHSGPGNLDTGLRQIASLLEEEFDVNVIVENHPGGSGAIASSVVDKEPADGYTFLSMTSSSSFSVASEQNTVLNPDWEMVASIQMEPASIAVRSDSPLETVSDFIEAMKEDSSQFVVGGYGSAGYMTFVYYKMQEEYGFEDNWIPIDTTDEVATGLLGGHIDVAIMTPSSALSAVKNGDVRILGVASEERSDYLPDVPTFKEQGYDMVELLWRGLSAKEGTPKDVIAKLHEMIMKVSETDEWLEFQEQNLQLNDPVSPDDLTQRFKDEVDSRIKFLEKMDLLD